MKIKQITETTTAGAIATTETALGGTQSRGNPSIYGGKKAGSLFKGKKTKAPYANSINESAELSEAHLEEDDIIVVPGQGRSRKNGFVPHGQSRVDHEVEMARSDLFSAAKNAQQVYLMIKDVGEDEGLDGWVQEKIIKANDYLNTIREYLEGKQVQGVAEGADTDSIWNQYGQYSVQDLVQEFPNLSPKDAQTIVNYSQYAWDFVKSGATKQPEFINAKNQVIQRVQQAMSGQQGVAEGSSENKYSNLSMRGVKRGIKRAGDDFNRMLDLDQVESPYYKTQHQQDTKQRLKTKPMAGPKGQLPEQGVAEGASGIEQKIIKLYKQGLSDDEIASRLKIDSDDVKSVLDDYEWVADTTGEGKGVAEGKRNLKCVCKTQGTLQCPVHTPKDIEVIEGAKVDRMVKYVAQSEKKLGHSKKEAENIAWATANKRGMLDNKNKKA
jgi:uncharacterized protein (DUF433 family)